MDQSEKIKEARETIDVVYEMSKLLSCDIDKETLSVCISLLENGVNPEALAMVMKELKKESEALKEIA